MNSRFKLLSRTAALFAGLGLSTAFAAPNYMLLAKLHEAKAWRHDALAAEYRQHPRPDEWKHPMAPDTAAHSEYYAEHCRRLARKYRALAEASLAHPKPLTDQTAR